MLIKLYKHSKCFTKRSLYTGKKQVKICTANTLLIAMCNVIQTRHKQMVQQQAFTNTHHRYV